MADIKCEFTWQNRKHGVAENRHRCVMFGRHIKHKCACGTYRHNPHAEPLPDPETCIPVVEHVSLRARLTREIDRWLLECGAGFQWTTVDVLDFSEIVFARIMGSGRGPQ